MRSILATCVVFTAAFLVHSAEADGKKDQKAMEGNWTIDVLEFNGESLKDKVKIKFKIAGDTMTLEGDEATVKEYPKITLKLDPTTMPKIVDLKVAGGVQNDTKMEGIYTVKGDELRLCINVLTGGRPTEFKSGDSIALLVLKREKP